nr:intron-encoded protein [Parantropora penelope]
MNTCELGSGESEDSGGTVVGFSSFSGSGLFDSSFCGCYDLSLNSSKMHLNFSFNKLYDMLFDVNSFELVFEQLKASNSFYLRGSFLFKECSHVLKESFSNGFYKPTPNKVFFTNSFIGKMLDLRLISVPSFKDKVVQELFGLVVSRIWFSNPKSGLFGFSHETNSHNVFYHIKEEFANAKYWCELDFGFLLDEIDWLMVVCKFSGGVSDMPFLSLFWNLVNVGYGNDMFLPKMSISGVLQGGVLSSMLTDLYLEGVDVALAGLCASLFVSFGKIKWKFKGIVETFYGVEFSRFANKVILGFKDGFSVSLECLGYFKIALFLVMGCYGLETFNSCIEKKFFFRKKLSFLGVVICSNDYYFVSNFFWWRHVGNFLHSGVVIRRFLNFNAGVMCYGSILEVKSKLADLGFCYYGGKWFSKACNQYYLKSHNFFTDTLNSIFWSIGNYYYFIDNYFKFMGKVRFILWTSAALMMKRKYKLRSLRAVISKFGVGLNRGLNSYPIIPKSFVKFTYYKVYSGLSKTKIN